LGTYGGPTQTMPLLPGSPALDTGAAAGLTPPAGPVANGGVTSITVASTSGLGAGLYIQIDSEIMLVTGISNATTLTVARAQLSTGATGPTTPGVRGTRA